MEFFNSRTRDDDRGPLGPCHEQPDCLHNYNPLPPSNQDGRRRKMLRQGRIAKTMAKSALLMTMHMLLSGSHASDDHHETALPQPQRRLQGESPWLPDQAGSRCTNDQEPEDWMQTHATIQQCCAQNFGWDEPNCLKNSFKWFADIMNPLGAQAETKEEYYYPDTSAGVCKLDSPERPEYITIFVPSHSDCCKRHIPWDVEKCLQNEPGKEPQPKDEEVSNEGYWPDSSAGVCKKNSPEKPEYMKIIVPSYSDCCKVHIPWGVQKCLQNEPGKEPEVELEPVPTEFPTFRTTYTGFYADDVSRKCYPNSAEKPSWNTKLAPSHYECCKTFLDWAFDECRMDIPPTFEPVTPIATTEPPAATVTSYYADTVTRTCLPNTIAKPSWNKNVAPTQLQCCNQFLSWALEDCVKNIAPTLRPTESYYATEPPVTEITSYYADTSTRKCLPNTIAKPAWNKDVAPTQLECCQKYFDWALEECIMDIPPTLKPTSPPAGTNPPVAAAHKDGYYADPVSRTCLPNTIAKPAWNEDVAPSQLECCKKYLDWALVECVMNIPPTMRPTETPTLKPSNPPTRAPIITLKPTNIPTKAPIPTSPPTMPPTTLYRPTWVPTNIPTPAPSNMPSESPTNAPTYSLAPTNEPTSPAPTPPPTSAAPTWSPSAILYYPDSALSYCVEDSFDRPQWNTNLTPNYEECCKQFLPWVYNTCMKMKPIDPSATTTTSSTTTVYVTRYYADTALSRCLKDSDMRPSWIVETALETDYDQCCKIHLNWVYDECMLYSPNKPEVVRGPTSSPTTTRFYADTSKSRCFEDSESKPSWIAESDLEADYTQCCKIHLDWVYDECMKYAPKLPPSQDEDDMVEMDATVPSVVDCSVFNRRLCKQNDSCVWRRAPLRRCEHLVTTTTVATTTPSLFKYYVDTANGKCLIHTSNAPTWTSIYNNFQDCCDASWLDKCEEYVPLTPMNGAGITNGNGSIVVEVVARGTLNLHFMVGSLPSPNTMRWTRLIIALRDAFMSILQGSDHFHPGMELKFISLGYTSLLQRRLHNAQAMDEVGSQHRRVQELTQLEFEVILPILCDAECQRNTWNLGVKIFATVERYFVVAVNTGVFSTRLFESGNELGVFRSMDETPVAGDATLNYQYSSTSDLTWMPTLEPSKPKVENTIAVEYFDFKYYPDYTNNICKFDGNAPDYEDNFFDSLEECCRFAWIQYDICKKNSLTKPPTPNPTRKPSTPNPTRKPSPRPSPRPIGNNMPQNSEVACSSIRRRRKCNRSPGCQWESSGCYSRSASSNSSTSRPSHPPTPLSTSLPTPLPTQLKVIYPWTTPLPTLLPTVPPQKSPTPPPTLPPTPRPQSSKPTAVVYYPDLVNQVCKFDGNHATSPYQFTTAQACCNNAVFDYLDCLKKTDPYAAETTTVPPTESPTPPPTPRPQSSKPTAVVYYPDLVNQVCKFDGNHATSPYHFATAQACCNNAVFDYLDCLKKTNPYAVIETSKPVPKPVTKVPTISPTESLLGHCMWHPNPRAYGTCTYSRDYPSSWASSNMKLHYLHYSYEACCDIVFKNVSCEREDACGSEGPDKKETLSPTAASFFIPSTSPTNEPSKNPTTQEPTSTPTILSTEGFTLPPVVENTIDASNYTKVTFDGFEEGLSAIWPWSTTPELPWTTDSSAKHEGSFSARSHPLQKGDKSELYVAIESLHGGKLIFWIQSDVQMPFSGCYIHLDDKSVGGYTFPTNEWAKMSVMVPPGLHVLIFQVWAPPFSPPGGNHISHTIRIDSVSYVPAIEEGFEGEKLQFDSEMSFEGDGQWEFDSSYAHDGTTSLHSPLLSAGQSSSAKLQTTVPDGGSIIVFWYYADVWMPIDLFSFKINGRTMIHKVEPDDGWMQFSTALNEGETTIEWSYERSTKDEVDDHPGQGRVWIDSLKITPR